MCFTLPPITVVAFSPLSVVSSKVIFSSSSSSLLVVFSAPALAVVETGFKVVDDPPEIDIIVLDSTAVVAFSDAVGFVAGFVVMWTVKTGFVGGFLVDVASVSGFLVADSENSVFLVVDSAITTLFVVDSTVTTLCVVDSATFLVVDSDVDCVVTGFLVVDSASVVFTVVDEGIGVGGFGLELSNIGFFAGATTAGGDSVGPVRFVGEMVCRRTHSAGGVIGDQPSSGKDTAFILNGV